MSEKERREGVDGIRPAQVDGLITAAASGVNWRARSEEVPGYRRHSES